MVTLQTSVLEVHISNPGLGRTVVAESFGGFS